MSNVAYELRADFTGVDFTGTVAIADGIALEVHTALEEGGGRITASDLDNGIVGALDGYAALKRVAADDSATPIRRYDFMPTDELGQECSRRGIAGYGSASVETMRTALVRQDKAIEEGNLADANNVRIKGRKVVIEAEADQAAEEAPPAPEDNPDENAGAAGAEA